MTVSHYSGFANNNSFRAFLIIISLLNVGLTLYATMPFGAGISGDAARNLSTAENLLRGKGFTDLFGSPLVFWPPLYPIILAGLSIFTKGDVFLGGWYFNVVLAGVNVYLSGKLIYLAFKGQPIYQYMGSLVIFLSLSSLRIHANIASDPLSITLSLLFLIAGGRYLETGSRSSLYAMTIYALLAPLQRFVGVILTVIGVCLIAYRNWKNWRTMVVEWLKFGIISTLPLAVWIIGHNLQYGYVGGNPANIVQPLENTRMTLLKILHWFLPFQVLPEQIFKNPWILILLFLLVIALINKRQDWSGFGRAIINTPYLFPAILFLVISIPILIFSIATADHRELDSDRYYIGLLVPILLLLFVVWHYLILLHLKLPDVLINKLMVLIFIGWSVYPLYGIREFIQESQQAGGVTSYNLINTTEIRDSIAISHLKTLIESNDIPLYSNDPKGVWFVIRQDIQLLPWLPKGQRFDPVTAEKLKSWPPQEQAYIIWLIPDQYESTMTPEELAQITTMDLIFSAPDGDIYLVHPENQ